MFSPLRNRFGIPGVISVIALVFAMLGGAYAATNDSGKATASAKGKPGPRGPRGKTGPAGPAGPQGPAGANGKDGANGLNGEQGEKGDKGDKGDKGANGTPGTNGTNGTSVTNTAEPAGANCTEGGSKLVGTSTTYACNGAKGVKGDEGSPWTAGGTLPAGETETGAWSYGKIAGGAVPNDFFAELLYIPISFPIPLAADLSSSSAHFLEKGAPATAECPGSTSDPEAAPGHLCIYTAAQSSLAEFNPETEKIEGSARQNAVEKAGSTSGAEGASTAGALIQYWIFEAGAFAFGTWAVTAPTS